MKLKATLFFSLLSVVLIPPTISKRVERDESEGFHHSKMSIAGLYRLDDGHFICSGVFITKRHIITAGDCFNLNPTPKTLLRVEYRDSSVSYTAFENFIVDVARYRNELAVIRIPQALDVIPISLISEDELKEAISRQQNAICGGWKDLNEVFLSDVWLLPEKNCVQAYSNLLHPDDRNYFDTNLHFCFQPMNCFQPTFYGGPLFINGKLAGIKVHNYRGYLSSLYMRISNLQEILDIISLEERLPLFEIDATVHLDPLVSSKNYQRWVIKYIDEPILEFNLTKHNNLIMNFNYRFPYLDKTIGSNHLIPSDNIIYIIKNFIYHPNNEWGTPYNVPDYYLFYTCKIFLGADIPTEVDYIMFPRTANALGFKFYY